MADYTWRGVDERGVRLTGRCRAESAAALREGLRQRGIEPLTARRLPPAVLNGYRRPSATDIASALSHLATLLDTGMPLNQALRVTGREQRHPALRDGLRHARSAVEHGRPFSTAAALHLPGLGATFGALLAAGEESGAPERALRAVADELQRRHDSLGRVRRAAAYPAWIASTAAAVTALLLLVVAPRFEALYEQSGTALPWLSRAVIAASHGLATALPAAVATGVALGIASLAAWRRWHGGRRAVRRWLWRHPLGAVWRDAALERLFRTLGRLLGAGVPLLDALPHAGAAGGAVAQESMALVRDAVASGVPFAQALRRADPAAATGARLASIGEESGRLDEMLHHAADYHGRRLELRLVRMTALVEPALIVVVGLITAVIVAALYLPIFQLGAVF